MPRVKTLGFDPKKSGGEIEDVWLNWPDYMEEWFGKRYWSKQRDIHAACARLPGTVGNGLVTCRSSNAVGKTFTGASLALGFLMTHWPSTVITTSASWRGVASVLWPEIRRLYAQCKYDLGGRMLKLSLDMSSTDEIWWMLGISSSHPENLSGLHNAYVMILQDEASGTTPEMDAALHAVPTGDQDLFLKLGNPIWPSGVFHETFSDPMYDRLHISSFEVPNVVEDRIVIPGLATRKWIEGRKSAWGEESPMYQARVLGEFPSTDADVLFALGDIEGMPDRERLAPKHQGEKYMGVDVARFGDDRTVFLIRTDYEVLLILEVSGKDTMDTTGRVIQVAQDLGVDHIFVDEIGVGSGVVDRLKEHPDWQDKVEGVNNAHGAIQARDFGNRRAESYFHAASGIKKLYAPKIYASKLLELTWMKRYYKSTGQMMIISKDQIKKDHGRSPDVADAFALTYAGKRRLKSSTVDISRYGR